MITRRIPIDIPCNQIMDFIEQVIQQGGKSIEVDIHSFGKDRLVICTNINVSGEFEYEEELVYLDTLFAYIKKIQSKIELVLNLMEPYLENRVKVLIDKWGLKKQTVYCGKVNPDYLTPWDRPYIQYNIENCLPNVYELGHLKRSHFDVIHYFSNKYKVKTIRLHARGLTKDIISWANNSDLTLSVCGISSFEEALVLKKAGVDRVVTTDYKMFDEILVNE